MADVGQHLLTEKRGERGGVFGGAGWAKAATLAGESHQVLGAAGATPHSGEAVLQDAAVEVAANSLVREGAPEAIVALVPLLPLVPYVSAVRLDKTIQRRRLGVARAVERAIGTGHGSPWSRGVDGQAQSASTTERPSR
jgi:hypothetical protein